MLDLTFFPELAITVVAIVLDAYLQLWLHWLAEGRVPGLLQGLYGQCVGVWSKHWHFAHQFSELKAWLIKKKKTNSA